MSDVMERRVAVISDIHANPLALEAVLEDIAHQHVQGVWCLGDMLGRGPLPLHTADLLFERYAASAPEDQAAWLLGNHDLGVLGQLNTASSLKTSMGDSINESGLNAETALLIAENREQMTATSKGRNLLAWMDNLRLPDDPKTYRTYAQPLLGVYLVHGLYRIGEGGVDYRASYADYAHEDITLTRQVKALRQAYPGQPPRLLLNGHTHVSLLAVIQEGGGFMPPYQLLTDHHEQVYHFSDLNRQTVYINPGSVGFPRPKSPVPTRITDSAPTYSVLTLHLSAGELSALTVEFREVPYDWRPYFTPMADGDAALISPERLYSSKLIAEVQASRLPDGLTFIQGGNHA